MYLEKTLKQKGSFFCSRMLQLKTVCSSKIIPTCQYQIILQVLTSQLGHRVKSVWSRIYFNMGMQTEEVQFIYWAILWSLLISVLSEITMLRVGELFMELNSMKLLYLEGLYFLKTIHLSKVLVSISAISINLHWLKPSSSQENYQNLI